MHVQVLIDPAYVATCIAAPALAEWWIAFSHAALDRYTVNQFGEWAVFRAGISVSFTPLISLLTFALDMMMVEVIEANAPPPSPDDSGLGDITPPPTP